MAGSQGINNWAKGPGCKKLLTSDFKQPIDLFTVSMCEVSLV